MPDTDGPSRDEAAETHGDNRNLPVPVPRPSEIAREHGETWIGRLLRSVFGWKNGTIRADLADVLAAPSRRSSCEE